MHLFVYLPWLGTYLNHPISIKKQKIIYKDNMIQVRYGMSRLPLIVDFLQIHDKTHN